MSQNSITIPAPFQESFENVPYTVKNGVIYVEDTQDFRHEICFNEKGCAVVSSYASEEDAAAGDPLVMTIPPNHSYALGWALCNA